jgi:hypothetical protein
MWTELFCLFIRTCLPVLRTVTLHLPNGLHCFFIHSFLEFHFLSSGVQLLGVDVSYAAPQAHGIVNVALHREYYLGIVFIFSLGRKDLYHV